MLDWIDAILLVIRLIVVIAWVICFLLYVFDLFCVLISLCLCGCIAFMLVWFACDILVAGVVWF